MRHKILWISFWTTLMFWLGGAWGCAATGQKQSDEVVQSDRPALESKHTLPASSAPGTEIVYASLDDTPSVVIEIAQADGAPSEQPEAVPAAEPAVPEPQTVEAEPQPVASQPLPTEPELPVVTKPTDPQDRAVAHLETETEPSLKGLDRSHWQSVTVGPMLGLTPHGPVYFHDCPPPPPQPPTVGPYKVEHQITQALDRPRAKTWTDRTSLELIANPPKFGLDIVLTPIKAIGNPPWRINTTPPIAVEE